VELGKLSGLSNPMLSQFENGNVNLSAEASARLLAVIGDVAANFVPKPITKDRDRAKSSAKMVLVQKIAAKLGASVALSAHSPTNAERLQPFRMRFAGLEEPPLTPGERELYEIANATAHEAAVLRRKEQYWRAALDKDHAQIDSLRDILGLRDKKILTEEAEQQKIDALRMEKIPPVEEEALRAEIEQHGKPKAEPEPDPLAVSKARYEEEMRRIGFPDVRPREPRGKRK